MKRALFILLSGFILLNLITLSVFAADTKSIRAEQIVNASAQDMLILDVRSSSEYADGHIPGAINIPHDELQDRINEITANQASSVVVYCRSGHRAGLAANILAEHHFSNVLLLEGHMKGWQAAELPIEQLQEQ